MAYRALGHIHGNRVNSFDARDWARAFMDEFNYRTHRINEAVMQGWFANALMRGYDEAKKEATMLSNATLNRVSRSYARGYRDGYNGELNSERAPVDATDTEASMLKPFANFDYSEGYKAGKNDRRWEKRS